MQDAFRLLQRADAAKGRLELLIRVHPDYYHPLNSLEPLA
jgi:hypothetical protein